MITILDSIVSSSQLIACSSAVLRAHRFASLSAMQQTSPIVLPYRHIHVHSHVCRKLNAVTTVRMRRPADSETKFETRFNLETQAGTSRAEPLSNHIGCPFLPAYIPQRGF